MDDHHALVRAYRNAWWLVVAASVFVCLFFLFTFLTNRQARPATWDMGGTRFVPASDMAADGWYVAPASPGAAK